MKVDISDLVEELIDEVGLLSDPGNVSDLEDMFRFKLEEWADYGIINLGS